MPKRDPINETDEEARRLARRLLSEVRHGAIAVTDPESGAPHVTRVAVLGIDGAPHILISDLSTHTKALAADPLCSVLIGEPGTKGDPLTHPRMTIVARAVAADKVALRDVWLAAIPKAQLYYDFTDFRMMRLAPLEVHLNGGFGKAFRLTPDDLRG